MSAVAAVLRSDGTREFGEDCREPMPRTNIGTELVVPAAQVLHKGVPGADYPCCDDASIKPA